MNFNQENFDSEVIHSSEAVLVVFWTAWCGHCMDYIEMVEKFAASAGIKVGKLNADENAELARNYQIKVIPTLLLFESGKVTKSIQGRREEKELKKLLN